MALVALGGALGSVLVDGDAAALCVAGVALGHIHLRFAWQVWHLCTGWRAWVGFRRRWCRGTFVWRSRRGTWSHPPSFCVAGVALMALGGALGSVLAGDAAALCVAGVALGHIHLRFTWQAWHLVTSTFVSRGKRCTYGTGWRAWVSFSCRWRRGTLRGRRGTWRHLPSFGVAGVALGHIHLRFAWQAWHLWYWVARLGRFSRRWRRGTLRGRREAWSHPPSFCVTGVALMALGGVLGSVLVAGDAAALCVAGVALGHIHLRFTWQAWHLWYWVARLGRF